jgi:hypothetical protein
MEGIKLPTKTKIAAWWMVITWLILISLVFYLSKGLQEDWQIGIFFIIIALVFVISAYFCLFKQKRWAWFILTVGNLGIMIFSGYFFMYFFRFGSYWVVIALSACFPLIVVSLVPFILLSLDRKNFFKIAS